jgi:hypothetical protein
MKAASVKVTLGRIVATPGALATLQPEDIQEALRRHSLGDWGDVCEEDDILNDEALARGSRILSAYHTASKVKFWVITEWNRSLTTVLLPSEY